MSSAGEYMFIIMNDLEEGRSVNSYDCGHTA